MKKQAIIIISMAIFLTMIVNIGDLRCQQNSNMINERYQSKYMENINNGVNKDNLNDDKNIGVEIIGWVIMHKLLYEYQKIDSKELEDRVERSR